MPAVPDTHTFVDGVATTSEANAYIRDPIIFLRTPPRAALRRASAQTLANATATAIQWSAVDLDTAGGYSAGSPTRYTAQYSGWYLASGGIGYSNNSTGRRHAWWRKNGTDVPGGGAVVQSAAGGPTVVAARGVGVYLSIGDYLELIGYQESGGNLDTMGTGFEQPSMSVHFSGA